MFMISHYSNLSFGVLEAINKLSFILYRYLHNTSITSFKTRIKVNPYLLNRSIQPSEILNNLQEEDIKELENININHQLLISKNKLVPKSLNDKDYLELLCLSKAQRIKYYHYLARKEQLRINATTNTPKEYNENTDCTELPNRYYSKYICKTNKSLNLHKLFQTITLKSQELIIDCSFEKEMYMNEINSLCSQIQFSYSKNYSLNDPFCMVFVNLTKTSVTYNKLTKYFIKKTSQFKKLEDLPILCSDKHYLDLFSDRRLIYLSPQSSNFFQDGEYDHSASYIIGGLVDKGQELPLTIARCRKENIEHRALPIDRHIKWLTGRKSLPINIVFHALTIARETNGDWKTAIENSVPQRSWIK